MYKTDAITEVKTIATIMEAALQLGSDIEHKLGAHPNYTDAQTKIADAYALLAQVQKEARLSVTFSNPQTSTEQQHALDEHAKFEADRAAGEVKL